VDFHALIASRRSIRNFEERPVPPEHLARILEAARLAPSSTNRQPWRFVLLTRKEEREKIAGAVIQPFITAAPALFVCCIDRSAFTKRLVERRLGELVDAGVVSQEAAVFLYSQRMPEQVEEVKTPPSAYLDMGIAVEQMVLQAAALGLGSCWVRLFNPAEVHQILALPAQIEVVALLPVGYPAENPPARPRLSMDQILLQFPGESGGVEGAGR
jgi:nitroreductase